MKTLLHYLLLLFLFAALPAQADPVIKKGTATSSSPKKKAKKKPQLYKGADYVVATKQRIPFNYTRSFSKNGKYQLLTTYNIYNPSGTAIRNIVAVHDKKNKTVTVTVKDLEHSGFPVINVERTEYTTPSMARFGSTGKVGLMANTKAGVTGPGQLTLKFHSRKFDYVKVVHMSGAHEDNRKDLQIFVLDEH